MKKDTQIPDSPRPPQGGEEPLDPASCSSLSRADQVTVMQKREMLTNHPHLQPEQIARHYVKVAQLSLDLLELINLGKQMEATEYSESVISHMVKRIKVAHREDLGIELSWKNVQADQSHTQ